MDSDTIVDFYARPLSVGSDDWLIFRDAPESGHCVRICGSLAEATERAATTMAQYHSDIGVSSQVHVQGVDGQAWRTFWHSPQTKPHFP